ncbi:type 1 glutamine amidotransferase [Methanoregula sp.]|uniref:type 1 glutamine amidotransferase n=1 Tax=Methanoregula sp. TaxID=2052170 RepID=UPI002CA5614F|nr:type 1 glutamine amidotransferase [Methanoregula sp.]HVP96577.1 type 1 glutamine amidotransferase [Methanoregula sp.]
MTRNLIILPANHFLKMITILQHGEHEPAGTIENTLQGGDEPFRILRLYEGDPVPNDPPERLIILGGQMSANDEREYPFLVQEKLLVRKAVAHGSVVLGICLGAQMIAAACGKTVYTSKKELGWRMITGCNSPGQRFFPGNFEVFHWHSETFDLPEGARLLATADAVKNQAFMLNNALGVQFHPEVTEEIIASWAKDLCADERAVILNDSEEKLAENRILCDAIVRVFLAGWRW